MHFFENTQIASDFYGDSMGKVVESPYFCIQT